MATPDRVLVRNLSRRVLRFGSPQTGTLVKVPAAAPTGTGAAVYVDASDPTVKRDFYRNLGSYVIEGGAGAGGLVVAKVPLTGVTATTGGAVGSWANPEGQSIIINSVTLDVTTQSTGAANVAVGVAANATTSATTFFTAQAVGSAGVFKSTTAAKASSSQFITVTGSADTTGLVANLYIHYTVV